MKGIWNELNKINKTYPYLAKDMEADVIVVGGGISGAITSYFLAKDGFKVVVLEENLIGYRNTSISSASICEFADELLSKRYKTQKEKSTYIFESSYNNLLDQILIDIGAIEYTDTVTYKIIDSRIFSGNILKNEMQIREEFGQKVIKDKKGITILDYSRIIDPYYITLKIFEYISEFPNVYVFENTKLEELITDENGVIAYTDNDFKIQANSIIFTTLDKHFSVVSIPNLELYKRFSILVDTDIRERINIKVLNDIPVYIRSNGDGKWIISGLDTKYLTKMENYKYLELIERENASRLKNILRKIIPEIKSENITVYSGNVYKTKDNLPLIGEIEEIPNAYINMGCGSSSIAQVLIGAKQLKEAIKGYYKKEMNLYKIRR